MLLFDVGWLLLLLFDMIGRAVVDVIVGLGELLDVQVGVVEHLYRLLLASSLVGMVWTVFRLSQVENLFGLVDIEVLITAVLIYLLKLFIINDQEDVLAAKLAQLHRFLEEIALSLALGVISVYVVFDQLVLALFGSYRLICCL